MGTRGGSRSSAGGLWRLRLLVLASVVLSVVAWRGIALVYAVSRSYPVMNAMDELAAGSHRLFPRVGISPFKMNPGGLRYPVLVWLARRVTLALGKREGKQISPGRRDDSSRCLHCGYAAGNLNPCPECGVADPRAMPAGFYLGSLHARLAQSRWGWGLPALVLTLMAIGYALPLVMGTARALFIR